MVVNRDSQEEEIMESLKYLKLLTERYPTISDASTEIINLQAILNLPKGTEHFLTDIHGEYEAFVHVLKNASGVIKRKIEDRFGNYLSQKEIKKLASLIYYPEQKLEIIQKEQENLNDWYKITLYRIIEVCRICSTKYTRSKVRKALPKDFAYIIEELLHERRDVFNKQDYYDEIINSIITVDRAREFIIALSNLIQRFVIDRLHIIGDIYDRGPGSHIILEKLINYHSLDIQWGNHDILWMGAAAGSMVCTANVVRISSRYGNLDTIEEGYGINLLPLATFAMETYKDDPCTCFSPILDEEDVYTNKEEELISRMHKAIAIIQFKLEGEIINRRREFKMEHRLVLNNIDFTAGKITIEGITYDLKDKSFPTINPKNPYELTPEEREVIEKLQSSFMNSDKLRNHIEFLFSKGSMYLNYNNNLLFHACIPLEEDGSFSSFEVSGKKFKGKELLDELERAAREGYYSKNKDKKLYGQDILWYLWTGKNSPLFGKEKMTTFERYFIEDKTTHKEPKNPYYKYRDSEEFCIKILKEFGLESQEAHIINGHMPVESKKGESPIKANGKLLVIDGGFSKAYQKKTGLAGYTLINNSFGLQLVSHEPFKSTEAAIKEETDIRSTLIVLEKNVERKTVGDTDIGEELKNQIKDLKLLLSAYRRGIIKEKL
ncbi:fructose-bisphosphatase class III [Clostridium polynesiense]|uniref:fructose-bisphosphatase class III n=1 Tax=Clostridium polynesiense TaxID=1325933 RepID=UPI00058EC25A|nr:fructose-bisphosphatase class III [Clostridium polynesiense]